MKTGFFARLFPVKYDFIMLLEEQGELNSRAVGALLRWLDGGSVVDAETMQALYNEADRARKELERQLVEAFSTPFDRGDIYYISRTMNKVLAYAESTLTAMQTFDMQPDKNIIGMAEKLQLGSDTFLSSVRMLKTAPNKAEAYIPAIRATHLETEALYRAGMLDAFQSGDAMGALRRREIYHHLKDASKNLEDAVDILHRIIVRLV
ncbi:DUF47 family protein [Oscillospiraceae bacterium WX1]